MAGREYFLTCCTLEKKTGFEQEVVTTGLLAEAAKLAAEGAWHVRSAVIMPDHVHLLVILGKDRVLEQVVRLFKGRTSPLLRRASLSWERGYFDRGLRVGDDRLPIFRYIFLNPYRARLLAEVDRWTGYYCSEEDWVWFAPLTNDATPYPEWLT